MLTSGIIKKNNDEKLNQEVLIAKYKTYARDNFQINYQQMPEGEDYLSSIKQCSQLFSFQLPPEKSEVFIHFETAPFFWLCDVPSIIKLEEWLRLDAKSKNIQLDDYLSIKEFYVKWAILKSDQEKKYFALSAIKLVERDVYKNNIIKLFLYAVILTYDSKLFNPAKALEVLSSSRDILQSLNIEASVKNELQYFIKLHEGFVHLKQFTFDEARQQFLDALSIKPKGINAKYYLALSEKKMGNVDVTALILSEILNYDKSLIQYAVQNNNISFLFYVIKNAVSYNIFRELEFADMLDSLEGVVSGSIGNGSKSIESIEPILSKLYALKMNEFYDDKIKISLDFLEKVIRNFSGINNYFINLTGIFLKEKVSNIMNLLIKSVENASGKEIFEKLRHYDETINDNLETIRLLNIESEESKKNFKRSLRMLYRSWIKI